MNNELLSFKSQPENYAKECDGRKPNTLRFFGSPDDREQTLQVWSKTGDYGRICIVNSENRDFFIRKVTDITYYEAWWIISWEHPR